MRNTRLRLFWHRAGPPIIVAGLFIAVGANQGCGGGNENTGGSGGSTNSTTNSTTSSTTNSTTSSTNSTSSTTSSTSTGGNCTSGPFGGMVAPGANGGFSDAFDAQPNAMGTTVFFTAVDSMGNAGVFKQDICPAGSAASPVYTGPQFVAPFGIGLSSDDKTVYVADLGAEEDPTDALKDRGVIYSLSAAGGTPPTILVGSVSPRSLTVVVEGGSDQIYFSGIDKATGAAGVFKVAASGGTVTAVASGPPFSDPAGITVTSVGDIYVVDTKAAASHLASIITIPKGSTTATEFVSDLQVGYPAGISILKDDSMLLVSGLDITAQSDALTQVTISSKAVNLNMTGIGGFAEAAGLHRAMGADVFAWADTKASPMGMTGTGTVFVIK